MPQLVALLPSDAYDQSSLVQVSVTCDEKLEVIDGAFHREKCDEDKAYAYQNGFFKDDLLSPLFSCIALNTLSKELNRTVYGYRMTTEYGETAKRQLISHLLYMDELKLYGRNCDQLDKLLHTVCTFSDDIQIMFRLEKCAIAHSVNGRLSGNNSGVTVGKTDTINCLKPG